MRIHILTCNMPYKRGFNDYYVLLKWVRELKKEGITFSFFSTHIDKVLLECDILIVDYRYFEQIFKGNYSPRGFKSSRFDYLYDLLDDAKKRGVITIRFDTGDSALLTFGELIKPFDLVLKKQVFKNRQVYRSKEDQLNMTSWRPVDETHLAYKKLAAVCKNDLYKIKIGWNIGLCDYRSFPNLIRKYSPVGTSAIFPKFYNTVPFRKPSVNKKYLLAYRGQSSDIERYDHHRKLLRNALSEIQNKQEIITGGYVKKNQYEKELSESKIGISPFGWGEICYRDFEVIINGSLLVKPDMSHLDTYPNIYKKNNTYVSVRWDFGDLISKVEKINDQYEDYLDIIGNAQKLFKQHVYKPDLFISHFKNIISSI